MASAPLISPRAHITEGKATTLPPNDGAWMFAQKYYRCMVKNPQQLHTFYDHYPSMFHGDESIIDWRDRSHARHCHLQQIRNKIAELGFQNCKVCILKAGNRVTIDGIFTNVTVLGKLSNKGGPFYRFSQTFRLAKRPGGCYFVVLADLRYLTDIVDFDHETKSGEEWLTIAPIVEPILASAPLISPQAHMTEGKGTTVPPNDGAWMFVQKYYICMVNNPHQLHTFFGKYSIVRHGLESFAGQPEIRNMISELDFQDCKICILKAGSRTTILDKDIHMNVLGKLSIKGGPFYRFLQSFALVKQPGGYYVSHVNFRYLTDHDVPNLQHLKVVFDHETESGEKCLTIAPAVEPKRIKRDPYIRSILSSPIIETKPVMFKHLEESKASIKHPVSPVKDTAEIRALLGRLRAAAPAITKALKSRNPCMISKDFAQLCLRFPCCLYFGHEIIHRSKDEADSDYESESGEVFLAMVHKYADMAVKSKESERERSIPISTSAPIMEILISEGSQPEECKAAIRRPASAVEFPNRPEIPTSMAKLETTARSAQHLTPIARPRGGGGQNSSFHRTGQHRNQFMEHRFPIAPTITKTPKSQSPGLLLERYTQLASNFPCCSPSGSTRIQRFTDKVDSDHEDEGEEIVGGYQPMPFNPFPQSETWTPIKINSDIEIPVLHKVNIVDPNTNQAVDFWKDHFLPGSIQKEWKPVQMEQIKWKPNDIATSASATINYEGTDGTRNARHERSQAVQLDLNYRPIQPAAPIPAAWSGYRNQSGGVAQGISNVLQFGTYPFVKPGSSATEISSAEPSQEAMSITSLATEEIEREPNIPRNTSSPYAPMGSMPPQQAPNSTSPNTTSGYPYYYQQPMPFHSFPMYLNQPILFNSFPQPLLVSQIRNAMSSKINSDIEIPDLHKIKIVNPNTNLVVDLWKDFVLPGSTRSPHVSHAARLTEPKEWRPKQTEQTKPKPNGAAKTIGGTVTADTVVLPVTESGFDHPTAAAPAPRSDFCFQSGGVVQRLSNLLKYGSTFTKPGSSAGAISSAETAKGIISPTVMLPADLKMKLGALSIPSLPIMETQPVILEGSHREESNAIIEHSTNPAKGPAIPEIAASWEKPETTTPAITEDLGPETNGWDNKRELSPTRSNSSAPLLIREHTAAEGARSDGTENAPKTSVGKALSSSHRRPAPRQCWKDSLARMKGLVAHISNPSNTRSAAGRRGGYSYAAVSDQIM